MSLKRKRCFLLVEVLLSLSLLCTVLIPSVAFYMRISRSFEEDILCLQLPALTDRCFFAVKDKIQQQMEKGALTLQGSGELSGVYIYTSKGEARTVPYNYTIDLRQEKRDAEKPVLCSIDVTVDLFPGQKRGATVQRCLCVER
ncbi:type II secretion system protein [Chlamydia sp.]|uniref:type II secretion system protein n=1 Tax=Chlamydia sp. TaxID=35827 RepID=UPI0025B8E415|nr:type II secretion system protein [Chlamydia sp.]MBQ8498937.1 type II secretion system protein [Chlamydia sp.]